MKVRFEYIEAPKTTEQAINFMQQTLMPLVDEYWEKHGQKIYGEPLTFNVQAFVQMWMYSGLVVVAAYADKEPVGFLFGIRFVPIPFTANALQLEMWYGKTDEVERGMFEYLMNIIKFMDITELRVTTDIHSTPNIPWKKKNTFELYRYTKE